MPDTVHLFHTISIFSAIFVNQQERRAYAYFVFYESYILGINMINISSYAHSSKIETTSSTHMVLTCGDKGDNNLS